MKYKYVVLEHLTLPNRGMRFWTTNSDDNTKLNTGEIVYKEILFTDDVSEATKIASEINESALPGYAELEHYYANKDI